MPKKDHAFIKISLLLAIAFLLYGINTCWYLSVTWKITTMLLFIIPLACQIVKNQIIKVYALWFGAFLVLQSLISPYFINEDFKTMEPNINVVADVLDGLPGISGPQHITTDSKGFRVTKSIDYNDDENFRIFAIGGSTTADGLLDDKKAWTHLLQTKLSHRLQKGIEVINTGVSGIRAIHHLATLIQIKKYHPDMVILLVGINDWNHHIRSHFSKEETVRNVKLSTLSFNNSMFGRFIESIKFFLKNVKSTEYRREYGEYYTKQRNSLSRTIQKRFRPKKVLSDYEDTLKKIAGLCKEEEIECVFLTQPTGYQKNASDDFKKGFWATPPNTDYTLDFESLVYIANLYNNYLMKFTQENGVYGFDLARDIEPSYNYFYDEMHFNINGAQKVADLICNFIAPIIAIRI